MRCLSGTHWFSTVSSKEHRQPGFWTHDPWGSGTSVALFFFVSGPSFSTTPPIFSAAVPGVLLQGLWLNLGSSVWPARLHPVIPLTQWPSGPPGACSRAWRSAPPVAGPRTCSAPPSSAHPTSDHKSPARSRETVEGTSFIYRNVYGLKDFYIG